MSSLIDASSMITPSNDTVVTPVLPSKKRFTLKACHGGLQAAFATATGLTHTINEDCCIHSPTPDAPVFCAVADGVGGGAYGEVASQALIGHCAKAPQSVFRHPKKIVDWLRQADDVVREAIARRSDRPGASTLVAAWFLPFGRVHIVNVGDCRAYRLSSRFIGGYRIKQITEDQTYANLGRQPPIKGSPDDPACMVGVGALGAPKVIFLRLFEGELLLLCSDGLHKFLPDDIIARLCEKELRQKASLKEVCQALVRTAKQNGSHDDVSVLLVRRRRWWGAALRYWLVLLAVLGWVFYI